jgi:hypothetical protein
MAIVAVAGIAAEGQAFEEVMGQNQDLMDLQRLLMRSKTKLNDAQQQNMTVRGRGREGGREGERERRKGKGREGEREGRSSGWDGLD